MTSAPGDIRPAASGANISSSTQLPTAPSSLTALIGVMNDPDIDVKAISEAVARYPVIAARLVALANSAWSSPVESITNIDKACLHLGFGLVRSLSLSIAVAAPFSTSRCTAFHAESFWSDAFLHADVASGLVGAIGAVDCVHSDTARAAALFANLSLLWLADTMPAETAKVLEERSPGCLFPDELALEHCGMDTGHVGGRLGRAWALPEALVSAMEHHGNVQYTGEGSEYADVVRIAAEVVGAIRGDREPDCCRETLARLRIDSKDLVSLTQLMSAKQGAILEIAKALQL